MRAWRPDASLGAVDARFDRTELDAVQVRSRYRAAPAGRRGVDRRHAIIIQTE
jgi:hypothetical protein